MVFKILLFFIFSYLIASIPFAYIITKIFIGKNIIEIGSKNSGATNVYRNVGFFPAILTLFFDVFKGFIVIYLSKLFFKNEIFLILFGLFAILGHNYSIFLKFKGGKGMATSFGVFLGICPLAIFVSFIIFIALLGFCGIVSISSMISAIFFPIIVHSLYGDNFLFFISIFIVIFIIFRHKKNIKRLINGTEKKIINI